ncbi:MAG TPA: phosphate ABC transporter permease PstA [Bacteroidales bacterium]|nr:phosphate ABC transporter permease PstA [Bacteroidales bacterium]
MKRPDDKIKARFRKNRIFKNGIIVFSVLTIVPIFFIIGKILVKGLRQINYSFFTERAPDAFQAMAAVANNEVIPGGIANGISGTMIIVLVASLIAVPAGLMTGVYLSENRSSRYSGFIRSITEILQGVPSIVLGIISYMWIVRGVTKGFSALAGSVALAIMMLPMIIRSTEETIKMIPAEIREAAYALGTPYHRMILQVLIPSGFSGLSTGILLSLSRVLGETAPLMMTALGSAVISLNISQPSSAVPLLIWEFYNDPNMVNLVWSSSLFLMALVLSLNIASRIIASGNKQGKKR